MQIKTNWELKNESKWNATALHCTVQMQLQNEISSRDANAEKLLRVSLLLNTNYYNS